MICEKKFVTQCSVNAMKTEHKRHKKRKVKKFVKQLGTRCDSDTESFGFKVLRDSDITNGL
jgi:N-glycosylase/DNA lyase